MTSKRTPLTWVSKQPASKALSQRLKSDHPEQMTHKGFTRTPGPVSNSLPPSTWIYPLPTPVPQSEPSKTFLLTMHHPLLPCTPQLRDGHPTLLEVKARQLGARKSALSVPPGHKSCGLCLLLPPRPACCQWEPRWEAFCSSCFSHFCSHLTGTPHLLPLQAPIPPSNHSDSYPPTPRMDPIPCLLLKTFQGLCCQ